jgi:para-nitrobenzyl esterase
MDERDLGQHKADVYQQRYENFREGLTLSRKYVYYQFSRTPPYLSGNRYYGLGATHGMEMPYVFDHLNQQEVAWTAKDRELAAVLPEYWTNFARNGDPNGPGLPVWPSFRESRDKVMFLGAELRAEAIPGERNLGRIDRVYATAEFASRHIYWVLALGIFVVVAVLLMLVMGYRRWARRRRKRFVRHSSIAGVTSL